MKSTASVLKRVLVGRPISTHVEMHHRLSKAIALPVFASDALSSSAYATDEILLALLLAGSAALHLSVPIAMAVIAVLVIVVISYQQTVKAYPGGGGAYIVAHDNLGEKAGLVAASSLLIDYVLTVSVSVAAGVAAIGAALPAARESRLVVALLIVVLISLANLRGLKESGVLFAIPTYGFLVTMAVMIVAGAVRWISGDHQAIAASGTIHAEQGLTLFLVLRAFASGSTALTGVEAISNGVPAFKPPEAKNAAKTLMILGGLLAFLFFGLTLLARLYRVDPLAIESGRTVSSQIAAAVFGKGGAMFLAVQSFTALILFLAANTSYADFPRLASILAHDRYLPRVFQNRGDKLAFSNGVVILAVASGGLLAVFKADVHRIIPLYVIGVFTSFTLSQSGMFLRWVRVRSAGWHGRAAVNGIGATTTFVVLIVVSATKFKSPDLPLLQFYRHPGAWQVLIAIPLVAALLLKIHRHYKKVALQLASEQRPVEVRRNKVVLVLSPSARGSLKAYAFARALSPDEMHVVSFRLPTLLRESMAKRWKASGLRHSIEDVGSKMEHLRRFVRGLHPDPEEPVTLVLPDPQITSKIGQLIAGRQLLAIKRAMLSEPGVVVVSVPFDPYAPPPERLQAPTRVRALVLLSDVNLAAMRALGYARSLRPSELEALSVATDPGDGMRLMEAWARWGVRVPLEVVDSPFRSIVQPLVAKVRSMRSSPGDLVVVLVPEFVVKGSLRQLLHGQTALLIKTAMLFEPGVVVISVPHQIEPVPLQDRVVPVPRIEGAEPVSEAPGTDRALSRSRP